MDLCSALFVMLTQFNLIAKVQLLLYSILKFFFLLLCIKLHLLRAILHREDSGLLLGEARYTVRGRTEDYFFSLLLDFISYFISFIIKYSFRLVVFGQ